MHFMTLARQADDPILAMGVAFSADARARKLDLGIGVYRDGRGQTPVMQAVKEAESRLLLRQPTKSYLGVEGDHAFLAALERLALGDDGLDHAVASIQTVGGTGALRLAADLLALEKPGRTVWFGAPSWPNHGALFAAAGLAVRTFRYLDPLSQQIDEAALWEAVAAAREGDVFVLHGCCHNPTGVDASEAQWRSIGKALAQRRLMPLVDFAYHGLARGLEADRAGLRILLEEVPGALVAYSCSKNFALYRERVGALFVVGQRQGVDLAASNLTALARANYSMPPDHGAAVVRTILDSDELSAIWRAELDAMRARVGELRAALAREGRIGPVDLDRLATQHGFFASLELAPAEIVRLREDHGVYVVPSGRINIAGLREDQVGSFAAALRAVLA